MKILVSTAILAMLATISFNAANAAPASPAKAAPQQSQQTKDDQSWTSGNWHWHAPVPAHHKGKFNP